MLIFPAEAESEEVEGSEISFGKHSWRGNLGTDISKPTVPFVSQRQERKQLVNPDAVFVSSDSNVKLDNPKEVINKNGNVAVTYYSFNGDGLQRKVISTSFGLTKFGEKYIPSDVSLGDESSVTKLKKGLSFLNLMDLSGKLNGVGKELVGALGIDSNVIKLLE